MFGNRRKSTPGKTLAGFVLIVAFIAAFSVRDALLRASHEGWYYPTALGDNDIYEDYAAVPRGSTILEWNGEALIRQKENPITHRAWLMIKVGRDDSNRFSIYRAMAPAGSQRKPREGAFYIKVGQGESEESSFLELQREEKESGETGREPAG